MEENRSFIGMKNLRNLARKTERKTKDALNFLALGGMLKKSREIYVLVENLLTQWETEEETKKLLLCSTFQPQRHAEKEFSNG